MKPSSHRNARQSYRSIAFFDPYVEAWPFSLEAQICDARENDEDSISKDFPKLLRSKDEWRVKKIDATDLPLTNLPTQADLNKFKNESVEHLILRIFAETVVYSTTLTSLTSSRSELLDRQIGLVFKPLLELNGMRDELLDLRFSFFGGFYFTQLGLDASAWLWKNGWPLHYVMALLERMEEIRAAGELDAAILRPIYAELLHWCPRILARLEELAAEPGPTSQRLSAAITTMRQRIPRLQELQAAATA